MSSNVEVCDAVSSVGSFIEFVSRKLDDDELTSTVIETTVVRKNAFTILTSAANHAKYLPDKRKEINNKTRMYNDIIEWLRKMNVGFTLVNIDTFGIGLVNSMTDGLWYIERNHDTLADMASPVLAPLKHSKTYYCPEKRKKKKVDFCVLNEDTLRNHSTTIMTLFFFQREQWAAVKQVCHTIPYLLNF